MDISDFFEPVSDDVLRVKDDPHPLLLGKSVFFHDRENGFPDLKQIRVALIGIPEDRHGTDNQGCALAPDYVRKNLYRLFRGPHPALLGDLGNIRPGNSVSDTYFAAKTVISSLIKKNIIPIIIGGSQDLTYANYMAYEELGQIINFVSVDARFDIGISKSEPISHHNYFSHILTRSPSFLFNFANIGYQTYFVDQDAIELMEKLQFDICRLGVAHNKLSDLEPVIRNADMISLDVSSIRQSDAPGNALSSPNGFYGEEACQITRYAGLSDKLSSIGFYEINPAFDHGEQTSHLVAQMIWYFLDGFYNRKNDMPDRKRKESNTFVKYNVSIKDFNNAIVFYKSKLSDRWWMEVPYPSGLQQKYERHYLVSCSYADYLTACQDEVPDKWWRVYRKFV